ncbi:MAG: peptidoglycan DD-metalloendopeptidase family protein [Selenomonadaceae bacterium]|nr:peptidoglycan DD-metalloendopeptidase family protein [Selenomonadaceae bacterium]
MNKFLILLTAFTVIFSATVYADETADIKKLEDEKAKYEERAEKARAAAELIQVEIDSVSELKRQFDEEAAEATAIYEERRAELDDTLYRIDENETKLAEATEDLNRKQTILKKRVRDIYVNGQISYLDVLFGAKDFKDFLTRMDLLKRLIMHDSNLVKIVLQYQAEIKEVGKQLEADRIAQEDLTAKAKAAEDDKLAKVAKQQAIIDLMENDKSVYDRQYDEMIAASEEVAQLIRDKEEERRRRAEQERRRAKRESRENNQRDSQSSGGEYIQPTYGGNMIWPVAGTVTSEFGWRTHPIFGTQRFHSGIDIGADYDVPIVAAADGVVIEAGWIGGYGNTIMIDHGSGISTLYGHNNSLAASVGQYVSQGEVIAYCGSTGNSTGPHCHFEVRVNGEPVSPYNYL